MGKRLPGDQETLHYNGIQRDGDMAYLYLRSAKEAKLSKETFQKERERRVLAGEAGGAAEGSPKGRAWRWGIPVGRKQRGLLDLGLRASAGLRRRRPLQGDGKKRALKSGAAPSAGS